MWTLAAPSLTHRLDMGLMKSQCRVPKDYHGDNDLLDLYGAAALTQVGNDCERIIHPTVVTYVGIPERCDLRRNVEIFRVDQLPLVQVNAVSVLTIDGSYVDLDEEDWSIVEADREPAYLEVSPPGADEVDDVDWCSPYAWRIQAYAGYGRVYETSILTRPLPENLQVAALMWVAEFYRCREITTAKATESFRRAYNSQIRALRWRVYP